MDVILGDIEVEVTHLILVVGLYVVDGVGSPSGDGALTYFRIR